MLVEEGGLHDGKTENEGDRKPLRDGIVGLSIGARKSHDKRHVKSHGETSYPEGLLTAPGIHVVETNDVCQRTNEAVLGSVRMESSKEMTTL